MWLGVSVAVRLSRLSGEEIFQVVEPEVFPSMHTQEQPTINERLAAYDRPLSAEDWLPSWASQSTRLGPRRT
jgi:hypothetical protein